MVPNGTEAKFLFFDRKLSNFLEFYYLEPGHNLCPADFVKTMNTITQVRHHETENSIPVKVSR